MRKLLIKAMVLAVLSALYLTLTAAAADIGTGTVDADSLRMRSQPTTASSTLTYLVDGTKVTVHEVLESWYHVSYGQYTGYVHADYLVYTPYPTPVVPAQPVAAETPAVQAVITGIDVSLRSGPAADQSVLLVLAKDTQVKLLATENGWSKIDWNGVVGYVGAEFVSAAVQPRIIVIGDCVNVRNLPTTEGSSILTKVYAGNVLDLLGETNGWYQISCNGVTGYLCGDYARKYVPAAASTIGQQAVELALSYLGVPYVYGGASPKGFDCSGFTLYIFKQFGFSLPHSATSQWNSAGVYVERADLQPGDLVLFCDPSRSNGKACSHVGIYIGNNEFVHASSGSSGKYVRISSLSEGYYNTYYKGAKRLG